jgi:hypothetical protein
VCQITFGNAGHLNKWMSRHLTVKKINTAVITFNAEHPFHAKFSVTVKLVDGNVSAC